MMAFRKDFTLFNCILTCFLLNELACCSEAQGTRLASYLIRIARLLLVDTQVVIM